MGMRRGGSGRWCWESPSTYEKPSRRANMQRSLRLWLPTANGCQLRMTLGFLNFFSLSSGKKRSRHITLGNRSTIASINNLICMIARVLSPLLLSCTTMLSLTVTQFLLTFQLPQEKVTLPCAPFLTHSDQLSPNTSTKQKSRLT